MRSTIMFPLPFLILMADYSRSILALSFFTLGLSRMGCRWVGSGGIRGVRVVIGIHWCASATGVHIWFLIIFDF